MKKKHANYNCVHEKESSSNQIKDILKVIIVRAVQTQFQLSLHSEGIARISYSKFVVSNQYAKKTLSFPFLPQTPAAPQKAE